MFCSKCQHFWNAAVERAVVSDHGERTEDIRWSGFRCILYHKLRDLKLASDSRCILCRIVYHTPSELEHEHFLRDHDESLDVLLELDAGQGLYPTLFVTFCEPSGGMARVPRRMIAVCGGLLSDS